MTSKGTIVVPKYFATSRYQIILHPRYNTIRQPLGKPTSYISSLESTHKKDKLGAKQYTHKYHYHWQTPHTNHSKWIPPTQLLNPDTILYDNNLLLVTKFLQNKTSRHRKKANHATNKIPNNHATNEMIAMDSTSPTLPKYTNTWETTKPLYRLKD